MNKIDHYDDGIHNYSFGRKQAADPERNGATHLTQWQGIPHPPRREKKANEMQSGNALPAGGFDPTQQPRRMGDVEFMKTRNGGKDKVVRRFDPATGKWRYTALGMAFFSIKGIEFVVRIPAIFAGTKANGEAYSRHGFFPVTNIQIPGGTPDAQRDNRIKAEVKRQFSAWPILAEYSGI